MIRNILTATSCRSSPSSYYGRFFFSSRRRHTRCLSDWSSDVCSSDLAVLVASPTPAVAAADAHVHFTHRHRPSGRTEQPLLHQRWFGVRLVDQRPRRLERPDRKSVV